MTTTHKVLILLATAGVLAGGTYLGYRAYSTLKNKPTTTQTKTATSTGSTVTTTSTTSSTQPSVTNIISPPAIDATWRTFRSPDGEFEFMWPTQGKYAPQWKHTYVRKSDKTLTATGCYLPDVGWSIQTFTVNNLNFCQTSKSLMSNNKTFLTDHFTVSKDQNQFVVLNFTKDFVSTAGNFNVREYDQFIKQIAYTFHFSKPMQTATTWKTEKNTDLKLEYKSPSSDRCVLPKSADDAGTCYPIDANGQALGYTPSAGISLLNQSIEQAMLEFDPIESKTPFTTDGGLKGTKIRAAYGKGLCTAFLVELEPNKLLQFMPWECEGEWEPLETITKSIKKI